MYTVHKQSTLEDIQINEEYHRLFIETQLVSFEEAAEQIQVTQDQLKSFIKEGMIEPFVKKRGSILFHQRNVEQMQKQVATERKGTESEYFIDERKGITQYSKSFFHDHIDKLGDISHIFIYFYEADAAKDGFYRLERSDKERGNFRDLESPNMIIRDTQGKEMWLYGCNCGYSGEGPHGSKDILAELGFPKEQQDHIFYHRVVKYFRKEDDSWEIIGHGPSPFKYPRLYKDSLAVRISFDDPLDITWIRSFIPDPIKFQVLENVEEANDQGFIPHPWELRDRHWYPFVVTDRSGRTALIKPSENYKADEYIPILLDLFDFKIQSLDKSPWSKLSDTVESLKNIWGSQLRIQDCEMEYKPPITNKQYSILK